jgi:ribosomal protein S4E
MVGSPNLTLSTFEPNGGDSPLKNLEVRCGIFYDMKTDAANKLKDGASCKVIAGTHKGKSGIVRDIKTGKTGHISITVVQSDGVKLKTLAKNVAIV